MTINIPPGAVVVGVDGSAHSDRALAEAVTLARVARRDLHVLHAYDPTPWRATIEGPVRSADELATLLAADAHTVVDRARALATRKLSEEQVSTSLVEGDARDALDHASTVALVLVLGSHGRGTLATLTLGSVSVHVAQHAWCPVVVSRPRPRRTATDRVMVGVDGTELSSDALRFAFEQASARRAPLTVVHCFEDVFAAGYDLAGIADDLVDLRPPRLLVAESVAGLRDDFPDVPVAVELGRGRAASYLAQASARAVLMVVGARRTGVTRHLPGGSTSRALVEHAKCTVAVVPTTAPHPARGTRQPVDALHA